MPRSITGPRVWVPVPLGLTAPTRSPTTGCGEGVQRPTARSSSAFDIDERPFTP